MTDRLADNISRDLSSVKGRQYVIAFALTDAVFVASRARIVLVLRRSPGDQMTEAFICDYVRTPIGRYGGALAVERV